MSTSPTILIVDDDSAHRNMLRMVLRGWGYETDEADDGDTAVEKVRERAEAAAYGSDGLRYALGFYRVLPRGFSLFGELSLTTARHHEAQWHITRDHRIAETRRNDRTWQVFASLSSNLFEKYNVTPALQYMYIKRDSNMWAQEYARQRLNLSFGYRF